MKWLRFLKNNNKNEDSSGKSAVRFLVANKLRKPLIIAGLSVVGIIIICVFVYVIIYTFTQLASLNSLEIALSERYDPNTNVEYEQKVIERSDFVNFTQYFDATDEKLTENHEKYFDNLYAAYEFYKNEDNMTFWESISSFFSKIFSFDKRKDSVPLYPDNTNTKKYGIQIDTTLITATLYNSRYQSDMTREDDFAQEYSYFALGQHKGYDLHTGRYRDIVENNYLYDSKHTEDAKYGLSPTKKAIEGIEVLAKYQIKRKETLLTIHPEFVGTYYDTTRHIEIEIQDVNMSGECISRVGNYSSVLGPNDYYNRSTQTQAYYWNCNPDKDPTCESCQNAYSLPQYDDYVYCRDNELTENSSDCEETAIHYSKGDVGIDSLDYELSCEDYNEYLLGNLPTDEDVEMFCGYDENTGKANCYCNRFIESYYSEYVNNDDVMEKRRNISQIVFQTYSLYHYYENVTMINNVCSEANVNTTSNRDLSCEGARNTEYEYNDYYEEIDYDYEEYEPVDYEENDWCTDYADASSYNSSIGNRIASIKNNSSLMSRIYGNSYNGSSWDCNKFSSAALALAGINYNSSAAGMFKGTRNNCVSAENVRPGDLFFTSRMDANGDCHLNSSRKDRFGCVGHVGVVTAVNGDDIEITHITTDGKPAYTTTVSSSYKNRFNSTNGSPWIIGFTRPY